MGARPDQRYTLEAVVGTGGMGAVHRATDTRLRRTVAIKMLRAKLLTDPAAREALRHEAQLAAGIDHPGVAQVFDFEDADPVMSGAAYIVMQFVQGRSLADELRRGPMTPTDVLSVVQQVAASLQAAHDAGVVHLDLKPANIMLTPAGRTVLVDFGIAQALATGAGVEAGTMIGTTDYISPEQVQGQSATAQSDVYALGVVAYQCLSGHSPFRRETPAATALAHLQDSLPQHTDDVPEDVLCLLQEMTAKKPAERPASAADVARAAVSLWGERKPVSRRLLRQWPDPLDLAVAVDPAADPTGPIEHHGDASQMQRAGLP